MTADNGNQAIRSVARGTGLVGLLVAATLGAGCGGGTSGSHIRATWSLSESGSPVQCVQGDEVDIRVDTDAMTQTFACNAYEGITPAVTCGVSHSVSLALFDSNGNLLSSASPMNIFVPCGGITDTPPVVFELNSACADGTIHTNWILTQGGQTVECVPGDEVDLRVDTDAMTVTFPCSDHQGVSPAVTGGVNHQVSLKLFDGTGKLLSSTSMMSLAVPCGGTVNTPQVQFAVQ